MRSPPSLRRLSLYTPLTSLFTLLILTHSHTHTLSLSHTRTHTELVSSPASPNTAAAVSEASQVFMLRFRSRGGQVHRPPCPTTTGYARSCRPAAVPTTDNTKPPGFFLPPLTFGAWRPGRGVRKRGLEPGGGCLNFDFLNLKFDFSLTFPGWRGELVRESWCASCGGGARVDRDGLFQHVYLQQERRLPALFGVVAAEKRKGRGGNPRRRCEDDVRAAVLPEERLHRYRPDQVVLQSSALNPSRSVTHPQTHSLSLSSRHRRASGR